MPDRVIVIGLGRFGAAVARTLADRGVPVLAVDRSEEHAQALRDHVDRALTLDATDEQALGEVDVEQMSVAVCAIGDEYLESSVLTTALLAQFGVPFILARHVSPLHRRILLRVGAHETVNPEEAMGASIARRLGRPGLLELMPISEGVRMAEVSCPPRFAGGTIRELDIRRQYGVSVVAIRRSPTAAVDATEGEAAEAKGDVEGWTVNPRADETLRADDVLLVIGTEEELERFVALE